MPIFGACTSSACPQPPKDCADSKGGYDWTKRYPWIVESALKNHCKRFVIDGEAVVLGVDGVSDFEALYSRQCDEQVQLYAAGENHNGERDQIDPSSFFADGKARGFPVSDTPLSGCGGGAAL
jgi:hypothetical protein